MDAHVYDQTSVEREDCGENDTRANTHVIDRHGISQEICNPLIGLCRVLVRPNVGEIAWRFFVFHSAGDS